MQTADFTSRHRGVMAQLNHAYATADQIAFERLVNDLYLETRAHAAHGPCQTLAGSCRCTVEIPARLAHRGTGCERTSPTRGCDSTMC